MIRLLHFLTAILTLLPPCTRAAIGTATSGNVTVDTRDFPEIAVEDSAGTPLIAGDPTGQPFASVVGSAASRTFTLRNTGPGLLTGIALSLQGSDAAAFSITAAPAATLTSAGVATFTVRFAPASAGLKGAQLRIASNDTDENPFAINLVGRVLSLSEDSDSDGLSDASEFQMSVFGFDWQTAQPALVNTYFANANGAGLYTAAQLQALRIDTPLVTRNPATGRFKLTLGLKKAVNPLQPFTDFRFDVPQATTVINGQGKLEFEFTVPDSAAFFQIEVR